MINRFKDEYRWLSNFAPARVQFEEFDYRSVEHAYVASKTLLVGIRHEVKSLETAAEAKKFGKSIPLRPDWEKVRVGIMTDLVRQKFNIPEYTELLLATGNQDIVEGNVWHDNFWGSCICNSCGDKGKNTLGKIILKIRAELQQPQMFT